VTRPHEHTHESPDDGGAGYDWFKVLDVMVWVSAAVIAAMAFEWFLGFLMREKLARGAKQYLAKVRAGKADAA